MGLTTYLKQAFRKQSKEDKKALLVQLRKETATERLEHPTRLDKARALGYKAKQGYFVVRQRVSRGNHTRPHYRGGKKPQNTTSRLNLDLSYRRIAEMRVANKYINCEVLNSYYLTKDGKKSWYEVIMVDKSHPAILKDKRISWIASPANRGRAYRGLTSAGKKTRGLRNKGIGAEKVRPSKARHNNRM